ncbi:hypothetical protein D3C72_1415640 [compost metagenome]
MMTAPAAIRRCTTSALASAAGSPSRATEPAMVVSPSMSNRSLMLIGRPSTAGTGHGGFAFDVEQILDADRQAFHGRSHDAGGTQRVGSARLGQRRFGIQLGEHARALARRILGACQRQFGQRDRRGTAFTQGQGQFIQGRNHLCPRADLRRKSADRRNLEKRRAWRSMSSGTGIRPPRAAIQHDSGG